MKPKSKALKLKKKIVIPRGTILKEWKDAFDVPIGLNKDSIVYLRVWMDDALEAKDYFKVIDE